MSTTPAERLSAQRQALLALQLRGLRDAAVDRIPVLPPGAHRPLSFAQQRLWFLHQLDPHGTEYNLAIPQHLTGPLDLDALRAALSAVAGRHEVLRSTVTTDADGVAGLTVHPPAPMELPVVDLSGLPAAAAQARAAELVGADVTRRFDLTADLPLRAQLIRLAETEHVLGVTVHHIAFDQWSAGVFRHELSVLYAAFRGRTPTTLPALPIQYADYAAWQRGQLTGDAVERHLSYWRDHLAGLASLDLPADRPRPSARTNNGAIHEFTIPGDAAQLIRELARRTESSMFMVLLAAFQALLARYTGQHDIAVGTPMANRARPETEPLIGFFVNTLVLRTDTSGDPTFTELVARVRRCALDAYAHQDVPFDQVVDEVRPGRAQARTPLFDVMFSFRAGGETGPGNGHPGLTSCDFPIAYTTTQFDLTVELVDGDGGLYGAVEYSTDRFEPATVERLAGHLGTLLRGVATDPEQRIGELPLVPPAELDRLTGWGTGVALRAGGLAHELISAQARTTPDNVAVIAADGGLSYAELEERSNRLAHLLSVDAGPEAVVAVCLERGSTLTVTMTAVWKAGASYLPIDPEHPADRIARLLEDSSAGILVTASALRDRLPSTAARVVVLDDPATLAALVRQPGGPPRPALHPLSAAYRIYTSGSTGTPKAVTVTHGGLANLVAAQRWMFDLSPEDRVLQFYSASFDASIWEIVLALTAGAASVTAAAVHRRTPEELAAHLARHRVTLATLPPAFLATLTPDQAPTLHTVLATGERLQPQLAARWQTPALRLFNGYGPTETTVGATACQLDPSPDPDRSPPIGVPLPNTVCRVLDGGLRLVPVGVVGELFVGGVQVARGYAGRAGLTASRFVADPVAGDGSRVYRTGDLVRWRGGGVLEFVGRVDDQVQVRGYRVEPGEVQVALLGCVGVRAAVVVADPGGGRLVAYVVPSAGEAVSVGASAGEAGSAGTLQASALQASAGEAVSVATLRRELGGRLPEHMIPAAFVFLPELPLTAGGKVDRAALPSPDGVRPAIGPQFVAPASLVERVLADVWQRVLGVDRVGAHDDFFELGGDSIMSIQVVTRARTAGIQITPAELFDHPTIATLAAIARPVTIVEDTGPLTGPVGLLPIHRWWASLRLPHPEHFNQAGWFQLPGNTALLEQAAHAITHHHDALRLRATGYPDHLQLTVAADPSGPLVTEHHDCTDLETIAERAQASLNLVHGPIWRLDVVHRGPDQPAWVLVVVHHLAIDTISWHILTHDLALAHHQLTTGQPIDLGPHTTRIHHWAHHITQPTPTPAGPLPADPPPADSPQTTPPPAEPPPAKPLPVDHHTGPTTVAHSATEHTCLTPEQTDALLRRSPTAYRTQINDLLLAALTHTIHHWTGNPDLLIDLEGHGRTNQGPHDLSRTLGWFTTLTPTPLTNSPNPTTLITTIKEQLRTTPPATTTQPQILFNYHGQLDAGADDTANAWSWRSIPGPTGHDVHPDTPMPHLLDVSAMVNGGQLHLHLTYPTTRYHKATIEKLTERLHDTLVELIDHTTHTPPGHATPSDFPLTHLTQPELNHLTTTTPFVIEDAYPLSPTQQGMLFHTLLDPTSGVYFDQSLITFDGPVDAGLVRRAFQYLSDRHPILRTAIRDDLQLVAKTATVPFTHHDWTHLTPDEQDDQLTQLLTGDRRQGFNLATPPLLRLILIRRTPDRSTLIITAHHLLLDGWTSPMLQDELMATYRALEAGAAPRLPARRPYRDFIAWLAEQDQGANEEFWRHQLDGFTTPTLLATDPPQPAAGYGLYYWELPERVTGALNELTRAHQLTLNTVVRAALALLIGQHTGSTDVCFGAIVAGRPDSLPGAEQMLGLFLNTLPVRAVTDPHTPLLEFLRSLQAGQLEQHARQHTPLTTIRAASPLPPNTPLFDTVLVYQNYPTGPAGDHADTDDDGTRICDTTTIEYGNYPITLVTGASTPLQLTLSYDRARCSRTTIHRLAGHLSTILEQFATHPDRRLGELSPLTADERAQVLRWSAGPQPPTGSGVPVHELIHGRAVAAPAAVAVVDGDQRLTYAELDRRANRLAHRLRGLGVGPETVVAVLLPRGIELVAAFLGVLKAGGVYLPLDPGYPTGRLSFMLADSRAALLLTTTALADHLPAGTPVALLDGGDGEHPDTPPQVRLHQRNAAYLIYTSGSTGIPKGPSIQHGSLANLALTRLRFGIDGDHRVLQFCAASVDGSVWEMATTLTAGATLVIAGDEQRHSPEALVRHLVRHGVTLATLPPTVLSTLPEDQTPAMRTVLAVAEKLPRELADRWQTPGRRLVNAYGPTENAVCAATATLDPADGSSPPIGTPIAGVACYVLGQRLELLPAGVAGELYIGGAQLARGYHHRAALTAERFVADPFGTGERLYRTGDLARWRDDGQLDFLGRADNQVKIRGYRVELGEIEVALCAHPAVDAAVVTTYDAAGGDRRLGAYVVGGAGAGELRGHLASRLPAHFVPSAFVTLTELPRTPSGKVDRRALPAPDSARPDLGTGYQPPRTHTQQLLAGVWREVLGVDRVGLHDDFFELGGHSLLVTQVVARVRAQLRLDLPLAALFDNPTLTAFAAAAEAAAGVEPPAPMAPADRAAPLPLSYAQQRLWFLHQLEPGSTEYHVPMAMELDGPLDPDALIAALGDVVDRHEVLRTTVSTMPDGSVAQVVLPPGGPQVPVTDLSGLPDERALPRVHALIEADAGTPFDLAADPPLRARLIRLAPQRHVLALTMHHIAFDQWSADILRRELAACYAVRTDASTDATDSSDSGGSGGRRAALPPLPVQYADYAAWQRDQLAGGALRGQLDYWLGQLAGLETLALPTDRSRPSVRDSAGDVCQFSVPPDTLTRLRRLARDAGASMFMVLLAAFDALLARYTGQRDIAVGTPVANRSHPDTEHLIGFFLNTLVLRTDLTGGPSFVDLLARVRATALAAYANQDLPFEHLVDVLQPDRDRARNPLFQVMFTYDAPDPAAAGPPLPGVQGCPILAPRGTAKFDLTLNLAEADGGLHGGFEYSTQLFDAATVHRMAGHLVALVEAATAEPHRPVDELELLAPVERAQLAGWSAGPVEQAGPLVHELISTRAAATPGAVALVAGETRVAYGDLERRANRLAHYLRAWGVRPEVVVAVLLPRCTELVVAMLAIWKAGGVYLPLDPDAPGQRLGLLLADSRAALVLTSAAMEDRLPDAGVPYLVLDDEDAAVAIAARPDAPPVAGVVPGNAAYVIYTSGSTGAPKAVLNHHAGLANRIAWQVAAHRLGPADRILHKTPATFDVSLWELCCPLVAGATLVLAPPDDHRDPAALARLVRAHAVTGIEFVPSMLGPFLDAVSPGDGAGLRFVSCAGEALRGPLVRRCHDRLGPHVEVHNLYGPAEAAIEVTAGLADPGGADDPPIGTPLPNTRCHVLDANLRPVPAGVAGELFIGGVQLARGYAGQAALTAQRFVADPLAGDGGRLYRTGDVVRWRAGQLEYLGRVDDQVKVRGHRVEPGEVESALLAHPAVRAAAVVPTQGATELVAYVVLPEGLPDGPATARGLRAFLAGLLPAVMVPAAFVVLETLPLTSSGKVDRRALPAPDAHRPALAARYQEPRTATEQWLAELWREVLRVERVGARDDFFQLGGHSLLATRVVARVRADLEVDLPVAAVFDAPTLTGLATEIDGQARAEPLPPIGRDEGRRVLSFAQQRLWFLHLLDPDSSEYHVPMALRLGGELDVDALRRALDELVARHDALRTTIAADPDGSPVPKVHPPAPVDLPVDDLTGQPEDRAHELVDCEVARPFDLATDRPLRARLVRLGEREHVLVLVVHHVAFDEWSQEILHRELTALYAAFRDGRPSPLPPLPVGYADYAAWQRRRLSGTELAGTELAGTELERQLGYWRARLTGLPALDLPTDRPRPPVRDPAGAVHQFAVPAAVAAGLRAVAREARASMFMTLLAAFQVVLARWSGQSDVPVGTPVANRTHPDTEDLIGFFVNTLVLRTDVSGDPTFAELLAQVRATALDAYAHQELPFERLVDELQPQRDRARNPLFQVMFTLNAPAMGEPPGGSPPLATEQCGFPVGYTATQFDLTLNVSDGGEDGLGAAIEYSTQLFDQRTAQRLGAHFGALLEAVAADPRRRLSALPAMPAAERAQLVAWSTGPDLEVPSALVHELVTAHAAAAPARAAVVADGVELSYAELAARSNRLAHHLRALGIGPEAVVAVRLPRTTELMVAILAVLKAGAAYLPLDPDTPEDRLRWQLADSQARLVLTTRELLDPRLAGYPDTPPAGRPHPDNAAYLIYTSGSTGQPKASVGTHRNLTQLLHAWSHTHRLDGAQRWLSTANAAFDAFTLDWLRALGPGATLHLAPDRRHLDPAELARLLTAHRITALETTPHQLAGLLPHLPQPALPDLRLAVVASTLWPTAEQRQASTVLPHARLLTAYGLTETSVDSTTHSTAAEPAACATQPVGTPLPHTSVHVLDPRTLQPVPIGATGEIHIGGAGITRGYADQPALTANRFIANPYNTGQRLYRTGDLAHWDPEGQLHLHGRTDQQINLHGHRIEPTEIETALRTHQPVTACAVTAAPDRNGVTRLLAHVATGEHPAPTPTELREHLARRLPQHMIPAVFVFLPELPRTTSGKVDRAALPGPDGSRPDLGPAFVAPSGEVEPVLAEVWREVLGVDRVGAHDDFFGLGGHSLLATQVTARIRARLGIELPVAAVFDAPTLAQLATAADTLRWVRDGGQPAEAADDGYEETEL